MKAHKELCKRKSKRQRGSITHSKLYTNSHAKQHTLFPVFLSLRAAESPQTIVLTYPLMVLSPVSWEPRDGFQKCLGASIMFIEMMDF